MSTFYWSDELYHHGILGQEWGIRRYQNADGTLTEAGRKRYLRPDGKHDYYNFATDLRKNKLTTKRRAAKSILRNELEKSGLYNEVKNDLAKQLSEHGKGSAYTMKYIRGQKLFDKYLRNLLDAEYTKESFDNLTTRISVEFMNDLLKEAKKDAYKNLYSKSKR